MFSDWFFRPSAGHLDSGQTARAEALQGFEMAMFEALEARYLLSTVPASAAFALTGVYTLREDPAFAGIDGRNIGIANIDSGVFASHPDLVGNFVAWFDAVRGDASQAGDPNPADAIDPNGHGTHTSGTEASTNPDIGVAYGANLVGIRGLPTAGYDTTTPQFDTVANGLAWVLNHYQQYNIKVVNMSLGRTANYNFVPQPDTEGQLIQQLENVGITVVVSSGNNYGNYAEPGVALPAAWATVTVANTWADNGQTASFPLLEGNPPNIDFVAEETDASPDRFSASSQRSTLPNQVAAPGSEILSTWNDPNKLYQRDSGTSMSAPFVSGVVALMQNAAQTFGGRYLTPDEVLQILRNTSDHIIDSNVSTNARVPFSYDAQGHPVLGTPQDLPETGLSYDRVNAYRALQAVKGLVQGGVPNTTTDTNSTIDHAIDEPALNGNQIISFEGSIGPDGTVNVGPNDIDLYRITLSSPGAVTFAMAQPAGGTAFTALARLFDGAGNEIANSTGNPYPTFISPQLPAGTYYFGISSAGNAGYNIVSGGGAAGGSANGDYHVDAALTNPDPNGVIQGATGVDLAGPDAFDPKLSQPGAEVVANLISGTIGSDPNPLDPSGPRVNVGPTDVDMMKVVAPDTGVLTVDIDAVGPYGANAVDSYVEVYDANLNLIGANDDFNGSTDSFLQVNVTYGGTYYVAVTTFGNRSFDPANPFNRQSTTGETGFYDLYTSFSNGDQNGTAFSAASRPVGQVVSGVIGSDFGQPLLGANGGFKDVDFFIYTATSDGLFDATAGSPDNSMSPSLVMWKFTPGADTITKIADTGSKGAHVILPVFTGDTFYLSVTGVGNQDFNWFANGSGSGGQTGNYQLLASMRSQTEYASLTNGSVLNATPTVVAANSATSADIGTDGAVVVGAADVDVYKFIPTVSGLATFSATVDTDSNADPVLRVFDAAGHEIAFNDDVTPDTRDSAASILVTAGQTYYIGVNGFSLQARQYDVLMGSGTAPGDQGAYTFRIAAVLPPAIGGPVTGSSIVSATDAGGTPNLRVFNGAGGALIQSYFAQDPGFLGGLRVAVGDINGDGTPDIITGTGQGSSHVKVFDGRNGTPIFSLLAFPGNGGSPADPTSTYYTQAFTGGVFVASGDVNGDGRDEIIAAADAGATPHVKVYAADGTLLASFFAYDAAFAGGVRIAAGDVNGDGFDDIITGTGSAGPHVRAFSGQNGALLMNYFAYDVGYQQGITVAGGDVNGDGKAEVITATSVGPPNVRAFTFNGTWNGVTYSSFFAYDTGFLGGVRVAAGRLTGSNHDQIITGTGIGAAHVKAFDLLSNPFNPTLLDSLIAYDGFTGGVWVAGDAA